MESGQVSLAQGQPDLDVRSVAAGKQHYEYISLLHNCDFCQRDVRISVRTEIVLVNPIKCTFPTLTLESFQERYACALRSFLVER
jgi:hypothetical protein